MTTLATEKTTPEPVVEEKKTVGEALYPEGGEKKPEAVEEKSEEKPVEKTEEKVEEKKPEAKAEEKPAAEEKKPEDKPTEKVVPEKYDFKAPEGMTLDEAQIGEYSELAKKAQLDNAIAQELLDFHAKAMKANVTSMVTAQQAEWTKIQTDWKAEIDKDPELGAQKTEVTTRIGRLLDEYGSKEARDAFDLTGAGNNPAVIRLLNNIAKKVVEAGPKPQGKPAGQAKVKTLGGVLYPDNKEAN